ncbi:MAG: glutamine synthetase family protein [Bacteroidota bacterium]
MKEINHQRTRIAITDIDGVLRGKYINADKLKKATENGFGFCNVVFGWDIKDVCYENSKVSGWHTGYPDAIAKVDLNTKREIPWDENTPFFLADFSEAQSEIQAVCPRTLLKKIRQQCLDLGYQPFFSNEYEWFNFRETPQSLSDKNYTQPQPLTPDMFGYSLLRMSLNQAYINDLFEQLTQFQVPIEGLHTETGDGVYEAAIVYSDILEAADRAILFKTSVKEIAYRHQIMASFMAKWNANLPGCSGHIHQSLWDVEKKKNLFYNTDNQYNISQLMQHYIAGQLHCLPHILPMLAPTINSYKRLVVGSWASVSASWGIENRTTALRVIPYEENSMRLETRVPGADANPYLAMAASLASGLYGIRHQLLLEIEPTHGNEYENSKNQALPKNLWTATQAMKSSPIAQELFGETFTDHFLRTREWEWQQYEQQVSDWELKRYFELI